MKRIATGTSHGELLARFGETMDPAIVKAFADRINPLKSVTRPNDYFYHAAELQSPGLVAALAEMGFTPNTCDQLDHGLHVAVQAGDARIVEAMLDAGARVDLRDETGATGLLIAAGRGDLALVDWFLSRGANPKAKDEGGQTAIVVAANNGERAVVERLAPLSSPQNRKFAERILARPQQLDPRAEEFHELRRRAIVIAHRPERMKELRAMLDNGVPVDVPGYGGQTVLMGANRPSRLELADLFLEYGASADAADDAGQTALDWAVWGDNPELYQRLYEIASSDTRKQARRLLRRLRGTHVCKHPGWADVA